MIRQIILSCLFLVAVVFVSNAQETENSKISPEKRDKWAKETAAGLMIFQPDSSVRVISPDILYTGEKNKISYRINKKSLIRLNNGGWIFIVPHSSHDDEEIGDLSLAVDHNKNIYICDAHVCGGIIHFETDQITELKETSEFFKYFISETDSKGWSKFAN